MKLLFIVALSLVPFLANAQTEKFYIALQVQPELTFHRSNYPSTYPPAHGKSAFNIGFNMNGQYQITDHLFTMLGVGFISRQLNTQVNFSQSRLPEPYYDSVAGPAIFTKRLSYRILQIPVGLGYSFFKAKKTNLSASLIFIPNYLLNAKYNVPGYPTFKKNYWLGISLNPTIGVDHALSKKIKLTGALAYSIINTVKEEEFSNKEPKLTHHYLQLSLGAKLKLR